MLVVTPSRQEQQPKQKPTASIALTASRPSCVACQLPGCQVRPGAMLSCCIGPHTCYSYDPSVNISTMLSSRRRAHVHLRPVLAPGGGRPVPLLRSSPLSHSHRTGSAMPAPSWYTRSRSCCGRSTCPPLRSCGRARPAYHAVSCLFGAPWRALRVPNTQTYSARLDLSHGRPIIGWCPGEFGTGRLVKTSNSVGVTSSARY